MVGMFLHVLTVLFRNGEYDYLFMLGLQVILVSKMVAT